MRELEKRFERSELVHHFERRRMDGIAAEIPQEILMLFKHDNGDPGAGQQQPEHHPCGTTANNAAGCFDPVHITAPRHRETTPLESP
ncbi:hypothetical protein D3C83_43060 [compost metagenome]